MTDLMTAAETDLLAENERVIERGIQTFTEVGNALLKIRDDRLYRADFGTFEGYCRERWGFNDRRAAQLISAASVVSTIVETGLPAPANEGQARALARVPEPERAEVWRETVERTGGKPTAAAIRKTYQPPRPAPPAQPAAQPTLPVTRPVHDTPEPSPVPTRTAPVLLTLRTHKGDAVNYPKPQSKPTFNLSLSDGISWANWSWNPVTGCLHGCGYCYARAIINRYPDANPAGFTPLFHNERLGAPANTTIPAAHRDDDHPSCNRGDCDVCAYRRVFVCSMADLYGRWVPDEWIDQVHAAMLDSPEWQYILLTKFPSRYPGLKLPPGAWVGTSVDEQKRVRIAENAFRDIEGGAVKWLSLEPLKEPLEFNDLSVFDWVVIGAQTETRQPDGTVPAFAPPFDWVARIVVQAREAGCRVHLKPNLINGRPGMQFPDEYPGGDQ